MLNKRSTDNLVLKVVKILEPKILLIVLFITGASVLVIEVTAIRVLAPYFGSTLYSLSSILAVILGALSWGYLVGGKLSEKDANEKSFYIFILIAGISVLIINFLSIFLLPSVGHRLSYVYGPLLISSILFTIPSFYLGVLSPYAIEIIKKRKPKDGLGKISSQVICISTIGSIFGSIITGFFLIPNFGVETIVNSTGILLILIGLAGITQANLLKKSPLKIIIFSIFIFSLNQTLLKIRNETILYTNDGLYGRISIYYTYKDNKKIRVLTQDVGAMSGKFLESDDLAFDYAKYLSLHNLFGTNLKNALFIGGGAYTLPDLLIKNLPDVMVDIAEVEPSLYYLSKEYFGLSSSLQLTNYIIDGRKFLNDTDKKYDLIFADAYASILSVPVHMSTIEFFQKGFDALNDNGLFMANIIGDLDESLPSYLFSEIKTFKEVFPNSYFFASEGLLTKYPQNIIFIGFKSDERLDFKDLKETSFSGIQIRNLDKKFMDIDRYNLAKHIIFTDNFSPVEAYTAKYLKRNR